MKLIAWIKDVFFDICPKHNEKRKQVMTYGTPKTKCFKCAEQTIVPKEL